MPNRTSGVSNPILATVRTCCAAPMEMCMSKRLIARPHALALGPPPDFFTLYALPYCYNPMQRNHVVAPFSARFGKLTEAIAALRNYGLFLTCDAATENCLLDQNEVAKGQLRVLTALLGRKCPAPPLLAWDEFQLALSLTGRASSLMRLAAEPISKSSPDGCYRGEDSLTIDRKYQSAWTGRLPTRILILTNELPRLADASGALASRFVTLVMTKSFYEQEDLGLASRLLAELPSILNWALEGRDRLERRGYFVPPTSSTEVARELEDLGSPIGAFLRDRCEVAPGQTTEVATLFELADLVRNPGRDKAGTANRSLRDAGRKFRRELCNLEPVHEDICP
jgi:putative DNA primase/helicase